MFKYSVKEAEIKKVEEKITFEELFNLSIEFETIPQSLEQFAFRKFGFDYWKNPVCVAYLRNMITLYEGGRI